MDNGTPVMRRAPREQLMFFLSILFAVTPFAFALIRAFSTGYDLRYLWVALASFLGAAVVMSVGKSRSGKSKGLLALSAMVLVVATLLAGLAAFLLGAKSVVGAGTVALAFGLCCAASSALYALSRPRII